MTYTITTAQRQQLKDLLNTCSYEAQTEAIEILFSLPEVSGEPVAWQNKINHCIQFNNSSLTPDMVAGYMTSQWIALYAAPQPDMGNPISEPVAWQVRCADGSYGDATKWTPPNHTMKNYRPLYAAAPQPAADVVKDAERYRWLRDSKWNESSNPEVWKQVTNEYGELDAAIDAAMLAITEQSRSCEQGCNGCDECTDYDLPDATTPQPAAVQELSMSMFASKKDYEAAMSAAQGGSNDL